MDPLAFFILHSTINPKLVEESLNVLLGDAIYSGVTEHREDMLPEVASDGPALAF